MWQQVEIDGKTWFIWCNKSDNNIEMMLYNMTDVWREVVLLAELMTRIKRFNRRIIFDENAVMETFKSKPETAVIEDSSAGTVLKLKYRVGVRPMHIEWQIKKLSSQELNQFIVMPLFCTIGDMWQKNVALSNAVQRKDEEIKQYKVEGATLRRSTVATKPFDFDKLDTDFIATKAWAESSHEIGLKISTDHPLMQSHSNHTEVVKSNPHEATETTDTRNKSPRKRKRMVINGQQRLIEQRIKSKQRRLQYTSSQSQSESQSSMDLPQLSPEKSQLVSTIEDSSE